MLNAHIWAVRTSVTAPAGLLEDRRAGWPLFRGKELKELPSTHTVRTLGVHRPGDAHQSQVARINARNALCKGTQNANRYKQAVPLR